MRDVLRALIAAIDAGRPVAWCRLVETRGSTPQKAGAAMLVNEDGTQAGTLGGGCVEAEVKRRALGLLAESRADVCTFSLDSDYGWDDGLICGGRMKIAVEPVRAGTPVAYYRRLAAGSAVERNGQRKPRSSSSRSFVRLAHARGPMPPAALPICRSCRAADW